MQTFLDSKHLVKEKMLERQFEERIELEQQQTEQHGEKRKTNQTHLTKFLSVR